MAYSTPHSALDYFRAAALMVCHDQNLRSLYRTQGRVRQDLERLLEVDLQARLATFFGASVHCFAQGTANVDIVVDAPTLRAEVKYLCRRRNTYSEIKKDWDWLLTATSAGGEFKKRAWVVFFPSKERFRLTACVSVPKDGRLQYRLTDFAPLAPVATPQKFASSNNQKLVYRSAMERTTLLKVRDGKKVRADLIGDPAHTLWAVVYTRVTPAEASAVQWPSTVVLTSTDIVA